MKRCKNCNHEIRKIKGIYKHRIEHYKYSGISGTGVTFNKKCLNKDNKFNICKCKNPI